MAWSLAKPSPTSPFSPARSPPESVTSIVVESTARTSVAVAVDPTATKSPVAGVRTSWVNPTRKTSASAPVTASPGDWRVTASTRGAWVSTSNSDTVIGGSALPRSSATLIVQSE